MSFLQSQGSPRRTVVQQHQPCPSVNRCHNRRAPGQERLQFLSRQFRRGCHKRAPFLHQQRSRLAVHHRNPCACRISYRPVRSQLSDRTQYNAAEQFLVFFCITPQGLQGLFLTYIRQGQPVSRLDYRLQCLQGFRPVILRTPDHPQPRFPCSHSLSGIAYICHIRHISGWQADFRNI